MYTQQTTAASVGSRVPLTNLTNSGRGGAPLAVQRLSSIDKVKDSARARAHCTMAHIPASGNSSVDFVNLQAKNTSHGECTLHSMIGVDTTTNIRMTQINDTTLGDSNTYGGDEQTLNTMVALPGTRYGDVILGVVNRPDAASVIYVNGSAPDPIITREHYEDTRIHQEEMPVYTYESTYETFTEWSPTAQFGSVAYDAKSIDDYFKNDGYFDVVPFAYIQVHVKWTETNGEHNEMGRFSNHEIQPLHVQSGGTQSGGTARRLNWNDLMPLPANEISKWLTKILSGKTTTNLSVLGYLRTSGGLVRELGFIVDFTQEEVLEGQVEHGTLKFKESDVCTIFYETSIRPIRLRGTLVMAYGNVAYVNSINDTSNAFSISTPLCFRSAAGDDVAHPNIEEWALVQPHSIGPSGLYRTGVGKVTIRTTSQTAICLCTFSTRHHGIRENDWVIFEATSGDYQNMKNADLAADDDNRVGFALRVVAIMSETECCLLYHPVKKILNFDVQSVDYSYFFYYSASYYGYKIALDHNWTSDLSSWWGDNKDAWVANSKAWKSHSTNVCSVVGDNVSLNLNPDKMESVHANENALAEIRDTCAIRHTRMLNVQRMLDGANLFHEWHSTAIWLTRVDEETMDVNSYTTIAINGINPMKTAMMSAYTLWVRNTDYFGEPGSYYMDVETDLGTSSAALINTGVLQKTQIGYMMTPNISLVDGNEIPDPLYKSEDLTHISSLTSLLGTQLKADTASTDKVIFSNLPLSGGNTAHLGQRCTLQLLATGDEGQVSFWGSYVRIHKYNPTSHYSAFHI